jgi:hypothetical protein
MTPLIPGLLPRFPSLRIFSVFSVTKLISGSRKYSEATQRPFSRPGVGEDKKKKKSWAGGEAVKLQRGHHGLDGQGRSKMEKQNLRPKIMVCSALEGGQGGGEGWEVWKLW